MTKIPESQNTTATAIVRWYESKPQNHRPHMGASIIGHACDRFIWNTWRWVIKPSFEGRILRLFDTGVREETRLLEELRGIGATVWDKDPDTGAQWRVSACHGHFGGSLDGIAKGLPEAPKTPAVLEFKTHSDKSFLDLCKNQVAGSKPQHYAQMQVYMGLMDLDRALYMAVNKNTDDVYCEWVHFNKERFDELINRAQRLIDSPSPPEGVSTDPANWQCKGCTFWQHCHGGRAAEANCRTCCHATPVADGAWHCQMHTKTLSSLEQNAGCDAHLLIPQLVPYAEPIDGGENFVVYRVKQTGDVFTNGAGPAMKDYGPVYSSRELSDCPAQVIEGINDIKNVFPGATIVPDTGKFFDDLVSDDPDKIPVKPENPEKKKARRQNAAYLASLQKYANGST